MIGFFQEDENVFSMARLIAFMAAVVGTGVVVTGLVFRDAGIVGIGAGLFGSGELLKYGQRVAEGK